MSVFWTYLLSVLALILAVPVAVFSTEIFAAVFLPRPTPMNLVGAMTQSVAVLVPAHNESSGILPTLNDIKQQLNPGDRLIVIADNCSDDTATVARAADVEAIERNDPANRGKGYALDFGLKALRSDPPAIVVVIDADCRLQAGALDQLAKTCAVTKRPAQALYLMTAPDESPINYRVAEFAWRVKNWVRPLGLNALKLPCQLMGTGMAFPWEAIRSVSVASGSIVEDLNLGLDLALLKSPALFCPAARVTSQFPVSSEGAKSQRKRWEQGHLALILTKAPLLLYQAAALKDFGLLALALDLAVPPLSLLVILLATMFCVAGLTVLFSLSSSALIISTISCTSLVLAILLSWLKYGRAILPMRAIFSVFSYIFAKLPLYRHLISGRSVQKWTRTDRKKQE